MMLCFQIMQCCISVELLGVDADVLQGTCLEEAARIEKFFSLQSGRKALKPG